MPRPTIENIRSLGDFLLGYRWNVAITKFPAKVTGFTSEQINFRCETMSLPALTGASAEINIRGHKVRQPGLYSYGGTFTMTLVETADVLVHRFLKAWREACWETRTGKGNLKKDVEATILLDLLDTSDKPVWQYELFGCFYESDDPGTIDATSSDAMRMTVTISYDYFTDKKV